MYILRVCAQSCSMSYTLKFGGRKIIVKRRKNSMRNNKFVPVCALHLRHKVSRAVKVNICGLVTLLS